MNYTYHVTGDVTVYPVEDGKVMKGKPVATFHVHRWQPVAEARAMAESLITSLEAVNA